MIITNEGVRGAGMTLFSVAFAYEEFLGTGKKVIFNYDLDREYKVFGEEEFREEMGIDDN